MVKTPKGLVLFLGLFILVGLIALGAGVWNMARGLACKNWPMVTGTITQSKMQSQSSEHGHTYSAKITYDYSIAGTNYTSDHLAFGEMSASAHYAQGILDRFPVGKQVPVFYSPSNPETAVLETGVHGGTWVCFAVGTIFVLVGGMFLGLMRKAATAPPYSAPSAPQSQKPPILMGVIFIVMGSSVCILQGMEGSRAWIGYAAGGFFVVAGLLIMAMRQHNPMFANVMKWVYLLIFLAIFHYVSFFSHTLGVLPFAIFTIAIDATLLGAFIHWLVKGRNQLR